MLDYKYTKTTIDGREIVISKPMGFEGLDEFYDAKYRKYTGIPSIAVTKNRKWVIWQTGGHCEPHPDNYCILTYSDDLKHFQDSFMVIEAFYQGKRTNVFLPMLINDGGKLRVMFSIVGQAISFVIPNPEAKPEDIIWEEPKFMYNGYLVVTKPFEYQGKWLFAGNEYDSCECTTILESQTNDHSTNYVARGVAKTPLYKNPNNHCHESMMTELSDGTFWMLKRIERGYMGGIEQSFSYDKGKTWTDFECNLGYPLIGPGSKFVLYRLKSGNILFVSHAVTDSRSRLIAHLSTNDGKSFDYSLLLDERGGVSYPEFDIDDEGYIYVIYDRARTKQQEIRIAVFNEDDLKAGKFVSAKAEQKILVYKSSMFKSIVKVEEREDIINKVKDGFNLEELPTKLTFIDEDNNKYETKGVWELAIRVDSKNLRFIMKENPFLEDLYGLLKFEVKR